MTELSSTSRKTPILEVKNLTVEISTRGKTLRALDGVDFSIAESEILGMVGESGAGKSMTGQALIGLLPTGARITSGELWLEGRRIDNLPESERERLRGKSIGAIFQDPLTSLDPLMKVGDQLVETIRAHRPEMTRAQAKARAIELLRETGIPSPEVRAEQYPHQFSGGMRQRVVIALALSADPKLIIADEPTTALDVSIQAQIISLLKRLAHEHGASIMLITHDMGVIAETADRVAVLYSGEIVEIGNVADVISRPQHPYTKGLMGSIPDINAPGLWLEQIEGSMPDLADRPKGCPFHPRCRAAMEKCRECRPPLAPMGTSDAACWLASPTGNAVPDSLVRFHPKRRDLGKEAEKREEDLKTAKPILGLKALSCTFDVSAPFLTRLISRLPKQEVKAVSGVSFGVRRGGVSSAEFGDVSMFSFHATKVFHTIEGGALCYSDGALEQRLKDLKNFGIHGPESVPFVGGNAKMNEFCAAMGLCNLRHLDAEIAKRKLAAQHYDARLGGVPGLRLNAHKPDVESNYAYYPVIFDGYKLNRDEVFARLGENNIVARKYFYPLTNAFECYKGRPGFDPALTPVARRASETVLTLPLYADLSLDDVDRICDIILE